MPLSAKVARATLAAALLLPLSLAGPARAADETAGPPPALADSLRPDPAIRAGTLPNGLRWLVLRNGRPEKRVALRLVVAAGSTAEQDDQKGVAHLVEHLEFDGSAHFKPEELVAYMQSIGMRFGPEVNAYTTFDETVYMLEVPTDRDTLLDRGMTALADFAGRATMPEDQLKKERGVVIEEWRLGRGAMDRIQRRQFPVIFHGSRYADRLPIGDTTVIARAPLARIRDFYRTWYTPERMAVIAVGDVDPARVEALVRAHFGDLPRPERPVPTPRFDVPLDAGMLVSVETDKELPFSYVSLLFKRPLRPVRTVADFRAGLVDRLCGEMLSERFAEISRRADAPFLFAGAMGGVSALGHSLEGWQVFASVQGTGVERGLEALLRETARVRARGFLPGELRRQRERARAADEKAWAERDKTESDALVGPMVRDWLYGLPTFGIEARHRMTQALLDGVTLEDVNAAAAGLMGDAGRVVLAAAPDKPGLPVPGEGAVRAMVARVAAETTIAWVDTIAGGGLFDHPPAPGRVTARRTIPAIGVTVLTLSNGAEVWLKPTDFKADEVLFAATAPGGLSLADSARFLRQSAAGMVVSNCGVGGFTASDLEKLLAGRIARVTSAFGPYSHGLDGSARPADLETALQLANLHFTRLTSDTAAMSSLVKMYRSYLEQRSNSPDATLDDTLIAVNSGNFYTERVPTLAEIDGLGLDEPLAFHRRLFANAADFRFFLVGSFAVDSVIGPIERTLASLPSTGRPALAWISRTPPRPRAVRRAVAYKGVEPKASVVITFFADRPYELVENHRARTCASILREHLRMSLREGMGGTYGASATFITRAPVPGDQRTVVRFGCAPERVDSMVAATLAEVRTLREQGPTAADVQREKEMQHRELEIGLRQNGYWIGGLQAFLRAGWDPLLMTKQGERIDRLTAADLKRTFRTYYPLDRYTVVTLLPEKAAASTTP